MVDKKVWSRKRSKLNKELKEEINSFENNFAKQLDSTNCEDFDQLKKIIDFRISI